MHIKYTLYSSVIPWHWKLAFISLKRTGNQKRTLILSSICYHTPVSSFVFWLPQKSYLMQNFYNTLKYINVKPRDIVSLYLSKILWVNFMQKIINSMPFSVTETMKMIVHVILSVCWYTVFWFIFVNVWCRMQWKEAAWFRINFGNIRNAKNATFYSNKLDVDPL
jgi:hypothetical protein